MRNQKRLFIGIIISCFCVYQNEAAQAEKCISLKGNEGTCLPKSECPAFQLAITNNIASELKFIEESKCYWLPKELYCCSSGENLKKTIKRETCFERKDFRNPAIPDRSSCGFQKADSKLKSFIVGGIEAEKDEFPWMAMIQYTDKSGKIHRECGGSLINSRYILTAAHCVNDIILTKYGKTLHVILGEHDIGKVNSGSKSLIMVEDIHIHQNYETTENFYDIALLRLVKNVTYSDFIRPICLAEHNESSQVGDYLTVAGWGDNESGKHSSMLLKTEVPFIGKQQCDEVSQICAGGEVGKDSCNGDSGGPLMRRSTSNLSQWYQEGIVSNGPKKCGTKNKPAVYTNTAYFFSWIHCTVKE